MVIVPLVAEGAVEEDSGARLADSGPEMPATAGPAPIFATFGLLFACAALGLRAVFGVRALKRKQIQRMPTA
jgi:hypothetical protein